MPKAAKTRIAPSTALRADATGPGGDGGLIEASSHDTQTFAGTGHASAPSGIAGSRLLDPCPCNGTTMSHGALWMGVPVLTMAGARHGARVGASLLTAAGRPDPIAAVVDDMVRKAVALAADPDRLAAGRPALRPLLQASRPCDADTFARAFEHACPSLAEAGGGAGTEVGVIAGGRSD